MEIYTFIHFKTWWGFLSFREAERERQKQAVPRAVWESCCTLQGQRKASTDPGHVKLADDERCLLKRAKKLMPSCNKEPSVTFHVSVLAVQVLPVFIIKQISESTHGVLNTLC